MDNNLRSLIEEACRPQPKLTISVWDVEHGLSVTIKLPNGTIHCIDAGHNNENDFSPFDSMKKIHRINAIQILTISHPDKDHIEGIPYLLKNFGIPKYCVYNETLPDSDLFGSEKFEYQVDFRAVTEISNILRLNYGGCILYTVGDVKIHYACNKYVRGLKSNDSSVVVIYGEFQ